MYNVRGIENYKHDSVVNKNRKLFTTENMKEQTEKREKVRESGRQARNKKKFYSKHVLNKICRYFLTDVL